MMGTVATATVRCPAFRRFAIAVPQDGTVPPTACPLRFRSVFVLIHRHDVKREKLDVAYLNPASACLLPTRLLRPGIDEYGFVVDLFWHSLCIVDG